MELPITIVIEPPSLVALRVVLRCRWVWAALAAVILVAAVGGLVLVVNVSRAEALASSTSIDLRITSQPSGAEIVLDSRPIGRTPASAPVPPGPHQVQLKAGGGTDQTYVVDVQSPSAAIDAILWRRQPVVNRLRPALPGAALSDARLQADGRVALTIATGADEERQAWRLDPLMGSQELLGSDLAATRLAVAPRTSRVATIGREIGPPLPLGSRRRSVVWLSASPEPTSAAVAVWQAPTGDVLTDVIWTPDEHALLAVTEEESHDVRAIRARVWLHDLVTDETRLLASVPSRLVPGGFAWRPDGQQLALLAHSGSLNALCLLDLDGQFRYLADLEPSTAMPLPYPPIAWTADSQRLAFAAPRQEPAALPSTWLQPNRRHFVYVQTAGEPAPHLYSDSDVESVAWREDGRLLALTRARDNSLGISLLDGGTEQRLVELPLRQSDSYAAEWQVSTARLLVASSASAFSGSVEYWLVRLGLGDQP